MDKSKPEAKPSDAKRQPQGRELKIEAVQQLEGGKISGKVHTFLCGNLARIYAIRRARLAAVQ
ncbi:hypothetical protein [Achromobacter spanius]|uniref:Uncharacterized protein n=1 Tax=Achromobacter spanius TaxID=217203 RepID=A0AA42LLK5_9BURK|nr:hypothetical protein [Achromobacter spanius]MDH0735391.1 hypothetical protein [Achromobacter spanius]